MNDCNQPSVLNSIRTKWNRNSSLKRFLNSANNCQGDPSTCDSTNFNKMAAVLSQAGLPLVTAFISLEESSFYPKKTSPTGAHGWWQFEPSTALGLSPPLRLADLEDIVKSTNGFVNYFTDQLKEWDGDFKMALISYNWGPSGSKIVETSGSRWKNDPRIPDDLKEDYSIYKNFWDIERYCLTKNITSQLVYAPDVLGAIFAGTDPNGVDGTRAWR